MNQVQVKYARNRAEEIKKAKMLEIRKKHTVEAVTLSSDQKLKAIKAGKFTINKDVGGLYYWYNSIIFDDEVRASQDTAAVEKDMKALLAAYNKLMDELILGDNEEALKMLKALRHSDVQLGSTY